MIGIYSYKRDISQCLHGSRKIFGRLYLQPARCSATKSPPSPTSRSHPQGRQQALQTSLLLPQQHHLTSLTGPEPSLIHFPSWRCPRIMAWPLPLLLPWSTSRASSACSTERQATCNMMKPKPKQSHSMRNTVKPRRGKDTEEGEGTKRWMKNPGRGVPLRWRGHVWRRETQMFFMVGVSRQEGNNFQSVNTVSESGLSTKSRDEVIKGVKLERQSRNWVNSWSTKWLIFP